MPTLIALQDIVEIKSGETFQAPDRILVAMGLAKDAPEAPQTPTTTQSTRRPYQRRVRVDE